MHTTVLGVCDRCEKKDAEIIVISMPEPETSFSHTINLCEECLDIQPKHPSPLGIGIA